MQKKAPANEGPPSHDSLYAMILDVIWRSKFRNLLLTLLVFTIGLYYAWQSIPEPSRIRLLDHFCKLVGPKTDIEIKPFVSTAGNLEEAFIQQKVERNFANLFRDAGLSVRSEYSTIDSACNPRFRLFGKVLETDSHEIIISIILQDSNGQDIGSAEIEGLGDEIKELYKFIPEALMSSMGVDTSTLKKSTPREHPADSVVAYTHFLQARSEAYRRNFDKALRHLQRALEIDPRFAMANWGIGEVKRLEGNSEEAEEWYRKANEIDPDHPRMAIVASQELYLLPTSVAERRDEQLMIGASYSKIYYSNYNITIHAWTFDEKLFDLRIETAPRGKLAGQIAAEFLTRQNDVLAMNGGFFDVDRNAEAQNTLIPSGLLIADGHQIGSVNPKAGSGVLFAANSNLGIVHFPQFHSQGVLNAVQAGPILVEEGGNNGIYKNDFNRQNRTAICLRPHTAVVLIVEGGLSLFEFAQLLSSPTDIGGFGCAQAINLDGGPSTQVVFRGGGRDMTISGRWRIQNAVVFYKRT